MKMGPLIACFNCGRNLSADVKIVQAINKNVAKKMGIEEILQGNVDSKLAEYFNEAQLSMCCRNDIGTYIDLTAEIYL